MLGCTPVGQGPPPTLPSKLPCPEPAPNAGVIALGARVAKAVLAFSGRRLGEGPRGGDREDRPYRPRRVSMSSRSRPESHTPAASARLARGAGAATSCSRAPPREAPPPFCGPHSAPGHPQRSRAGSRPAIACGEAPRCPPTERGSAERHVPGPCSVLPRQRGRRDSAERVFLPGPSHLRAVRPQPVTALGSHLSHTGVGSQSSPRSGRRGRVWQTGDRCAT